MKTLKIWQLKNESQHEFGFEPWERIKDKFSENNYKVVYEGIYNDEVHKDVFDELDYIYGMLNIGKKPEGYTGHSLSTSDIIELDGEKFYVNDYGYIHI